MKQRRLRVDSFLRRMMLASVLVSVPVSWMSASSSEGKEASENVQGQVSRERTITGVVTDSNGEPLVGVTVRIKGNANNAETAWRNGVKKNDLQMYFSSNWTQPITGSTSNMECQVAGCTLLEARASYEK